MDGGQSWQAIMVILERIVNVNGKARKRRCRVG